MLGLFFPPACVACGEVLPAEGFFCEACARDVERTPEQACRLCAEPGARELCKRCSVRPPPFVRAFAPFLHHGPISRAIHRFKYEDHPELAPALASLLVQSARAFLDRCPKEVAAIPLHASRFRSRRYDQAELVAAELAKRTGRKSLHDALRRVRQTTRQVGLDERERESNVEGAFKAIAPGAGLNLLLIDDVFTTGATARAAAEAWQAGGGGEVHVLTLARASNS